ncbi:hypothetical protein [Leucothrix arctica]|uniref:Uncharacterized protein n=1 Tax=Leucothrix arctica TaxID=1481894 RepID=A0A317CNL6_9GAMM|nr:hypothetical protein [Leucothrix arctica]PWQ97910.1 hypothetical protein DKT75_05450 [Leucothrix arctica]
MEFLFAIFFIIGVPLLIFIVLHSHKEQKRTKEALNNLPETHIREMTEEDLAVMQHYYNNGLVATPKMKSRWGKIYTINVYSISIKRHRPHRGIPYSTFSITLDNRGVVVYIPREIEHKFSEGRQFSDKTIEVMFDRRGVVLHEIEGVSGLRTLYQQRRIGSHDRRPATSVEQSSFLLSRWSTVSNSVLMFCVVPWVMPAVNELGLDGFLFVYVPLSIPILYFLRKGYIKSREIIQLSGELSYHRGKGQYQVNGQPLKLSSNWLKRLEAKGKKLGHVKVEAMLHTLGLSEDSHPIHQYQPISLKGTDLDLTINNLPVARSWFLTLFIGAFVSVNVFATPVPTLFSEVMNSSKSLFSSSELSSSSGLYDAKKVGDGQAISTHGLAIPYIDAENHCRYMDSDHCPELDALFFVKDKAATLEQYPDFAQMSAALLPAKMIDTSYQSLGLVSVLDHPIDRLSKSDFAYLVEVLDSPLVEKLPSAKGIRQLIRTERARGQALAAGLEQLRDEALQVVQQHLDKDMLTLYKLSHQEGVVAKGYNLTFFDGWLTSYGMRRHDLYISPNEYQKLIDDLSIYPVTAPIDGVLNRYKNTNYKTTVTNEHYSVSSFITAIVLSLVWLSSLLYTLYLLWLAFSRFRLR